MIRFMKPLHAWTLFAFFALLLAAAPLAAQTATPIPAPVPREIYTALGFGDTVFEPAQWFASATERDDRTTATWTSSRYGALGHAEYLHFDGGYEPTNLGAIFNDEWFGVSFKDYDHWQRTARCTLGNVTLHEFQLEMDGQQYVMRYWIQPITPTRILTMHMVFPTTRANLLDRYSQLYAPLDWQCPG